MKTNFIKKWNGKNLLDAGSYVSEDFNKFQNAMKREVKRLAEEIGAELVSFSKGHYDCSWFVERDGHYVYGSYSVLGYRSIPCLTADKCKSFLPPVLCRTAADANDYHGGSNNHCHFEDVQGVMDRLLKQEHKRAF